MRRAFLVAVAITALTPPAIATAQQAGGANPPGAASSPGTERPDANAGASGRSGTDDCEQGSATGADCSPSHVGSDEKSQVPPVDGGATGSNRPVGESSERPSGAR